MDEKFWQNVDPTAVARGLLGKVLVLNGVEAIVLAAEGYSKEQNTGIYLPVQSMQPGEVYCPRRRNSLLVLFVTGEGGCVLVRTVEVNGVIHVGPGKSASALGVTQSKMCGNTRWLDEDTIALHFSQTSFEVVPPSTPRPSRSQNGIGEQTLRLLMPDIVQVYMLSHRKETFEDFLRDILGKCHTEWELRRFLRER